MTRSETAHVLGMIRAAWPQSNIDNGNADVTVGLWHSFLEGIAVKDAEAAVRELIGGQREFAPPLSIVVGTIAARASDSPDFDMAWHEVQRLIRKRGLNQKPSEEHFSHPTVAAWAIPAWRELCVGPDAGVDGHETHKAQQRGAYHATAGRKQRGRALDIVGAPREGGLTKLDPIAALERGQS